MISKIEIEKSGLIRLTSFFQKGLDKPVETATFKIANFMENQAKKNIQKSVYSQANSGGYKRTRKALQSITIGKLSGKEYRVFQGVKYGKYIEDGVGEPVGGKGWITNFGGTLPHPIWFRGMAPRPFWMPAVKATEKEAPKILNSEIDKYLNQNV